MSKAIVVDNKNFEQEVLKSEIPVLVDFWATWCGPCRMMSPILDELSEELAGKLKICKVDTDENQEIASTYHIQSIPNMKLFKKGEVVKEFIGSRSKGAFKTELEAEL
jgi:thioredoxin 1